MHHQNLLFLMILINIQLKVILGKLEIKPLTNNSNCYIQTQLDGMHLIHGNGSIPCKFQLNSSGMIISVPPGDIIGTNYAYIERVNAHDTCSNSYVAFMGSFQHKCEAYFENASILNLHGDVIVSLHEANSTTHGCMNNLTQNSEDNDAYHSTKENQSQSCTLLQQFSFAIHCSSEKRRWQMYVSSQKRNTYVLSTRLLVHGPAINCSICSCILGDKTFAYFCDTGLQTSDIVNLIIYPPYVSHLDLSKNQILRIKSIAFKSIGNNITFLSLLGNRLSTIENGTFDKVPHLLHLDLELNHLTSLPSHCFHSLFDLSVLILSENQLATLHAGLFENQHNLKYFKMEGKPTGKGVYDYIRLEKFKTDQFVGTPNLLELRLEFNALTVLQVGVFQSLVHLHLLLLGYNSLVDLQVGVFDNLCNLKVLSLPDNSISNLRLGSFNNLTSLIYLALSNNKLLDLKVGLFDNLNNLQILTLNTNTLVALDRHLFAKTTRLDSLDLGNSQLTILDSELFENLPRLTHLTLTKNSISKLNQDIFHNLNNLLYLYLNINNIKYLVDGTMANMTSLTILSLAFNKLTFLPFYIFNDLASLQVLSIQGNNLQNIPQLSHMTILSHLNLIDNPLTKIDKNVAIGIHPNVFVDKFEVCACFFNISNENCYNELKPSAYYTCNRLLSFPVLTVFIWIIGLSALLGNAFVLWWKQFKQKPAKQVQSYLLSNLAMSDLLMGIYMILIASADLYYGEYFPLYAESWRTGVMCRIAGSLSITSSEASVLLVTLISIDRFINIRFPYSVHKLRIKSTRIISAFVWLFALTIGLVASFLAGKNAQFYDNTHVCIGLPLAQVQVLNTEEITPDRFHEGTGEDSRSFVTGEVEEAYDVTAKSYEKPGMFFSITIFIGLNMLCFLLILVCYTEIIRVVCQSTKKSNRQREMAEEVRMTMKVSAIVLTDFLCWFPICILSALRQGNIIPPFNPDVFAWMVTFVLPINSAINPFLYTIGTVISERCSTLALPQAYITLKMKPRLSQDTKSTSMSSQGMRECSDQSSAGQNIPMGIEPRAKCQSDKSSAQIEIHQ